MLMPVRGTLKKISDISCVLRNDGGIETIPSFMSLPNTFYYNEFPWDYVNIRLGSRRALLIRCVFGLSTDTSFDELPASDLGGGRTGRLNQHSPWFLVRCETGGQMIKKIPAAALVLSGLLFGGEALVAQNGGAQRAQPVATRENA